MRYLCLVHPPDGFAATPPVVREFIALRRAMSDAGVYLSAGQLQPADTATTLRLQDGEPLLSDGPYAEMKEQVGGFVLLDCADLDEAVRWAAQLPGVRDGAVEIRPMVGFPD